MNEETNGSKKTRIRTIDAPRRAKKIVDSVKGLSEKDKALFEKKLETLFNSMIAAQLANKDRLRKLTEYSVEDLQAEIDRRKA